MITKKRRIMCTNDKIFKYKNEANKLDNHCFGSSFSLSTICGTTFLGLFPPETQFAIFVRSKTVSLSHCNNL